MLLLSGVLAALWHAERTGEGQVVDAAMVDGVCLLTQRIWSLMAQGLWVDARESNILDGHAPWYRTYECADGGYMAVGAAEPEFYANLLHGLGVEGDELPSQHSREGWPEIAARFEFEFAKRTRDEWTEIFEQLDACVTPVLSWEEVPEHSHIVSRKTIVQRMGVPQAAPAPRFSATPTGIPDPFDDDISLDAVLESWNGAEG
jgi:alpha-methylacyl-CoA racemase